MPDETVVRYCAPTLMGIKTGNLFSCAFDHPDQADKEVDELDRLLRRKGMRAVSLGWIRTRLLIYHFGKSTTPDRPDQTWVNCLNLFVAGYTV